LGVVGTLLGLLLIGVVSNRSHLQNGALMADNVTLLMEDDVIIPADQVEVSPPRAQCARIGESCKENNCCRFSGYQCYRKDEKWSSCLKECKRGKENGDKKSDKPIVQKGTPDANGMVPIHAKPFFKPAPPGPWTCKRTPNLKPAAHPEGTTLFCFTVALSKTGPAQKPKFQDPKLIDLVKTQHQTKSGIFGCEDWMVFSDSTFELTPGPPQLFATAVDFPKPAVRPNTKQWQNTPLFANVWKNILEMGRHTKQDWTVKVDPTTVFLPIRLRKYLKTQKVTDNGIYLENCKYVRYGFHGSLAAWTRKPPSFLLKILTNAWKSFHGKMLSTLILQWWGRISFRNDAWICMELTRSQAPTKWAKDKREVCTPQSLAQPTFQKTSLKIKERITSRLVAKLGLLPCTHSKNQRTISNVYGRRRHWTPTRIRMDSISSIEVSVLRETSEKLFWIQVL